MTDQLCYTTKVVPLQLIVTLFQEKAILWKDLLPICVKDSCVLKDAASNFR